MASQWMEVSMTKRKYSPKASAKIAMELHAMKEGKLKNSSGQKVTNPKQAIAIGLSEARKAGARVPARTTQRAG